MGGPTVLVVEDEGIVARDIQHRLEGLGYVVPEIAGTGEEAITKAMHLRPDVILMDIRLRGPMDGIDAAAHIRERLDSPVVFVTAYAEEEVLRRARVTEPYGYVVKPFEDRELQAAVEIALYRHKAERKLADKERRYRTLVISLQEGIVMSDAEENIVYANPAFCEMLSYREDQLTRMNLSDLVPAEDMARIRAETTRRHQGFRARCDARFKHSSGELRTLQLSPAPWTNESGDFMGTISAVLDVTETRRAEARLKTSEARYRLLAENAADVIWTMDRNLVLTFVSPSVERLLGYTPMEMSGLRMKDWLAPPSVDALSAALEDLDRRREEQPKSKLLVLDALNRNGEPVRTEVLVTQLFEHEGLVPSSFLGVARDITSRHQAEEELRERTAFLEEVLDTVTDGIMVINEKGGLALLNAAARELLGQELEEWLGRMAGPMGVGRATFDRALGGEQVSFDGSAKGEKGKGRELHVVLSPMRFSGKPHVLVILAPSCKDA